jgi:chaperonin GroES
MLSSGSSSFRSLFSTAFPVRPLGGRVVIELDKANEKVGRLIVPETAQQQTNKGVVRAVGPGARVDGRVIPPAINVGDRVLLPQFGGQVIKVDKKEYTLIDGETVLAILP